MTEMWHYVYRMALKAPVAKGAGFPEAVGGLPFKMDNRFEFTGPGGRLKAGATGAWGPCVQYILSGAACIGGPRDAMGCWDA